MIFCCFWHPSWHRSPWDEVRRFLTSKYLTVWCPVFIGWVLESNMTRRGCIELKTRIGRWPQKSWLMGWLNKRNFGVPKLAGRATDGNSNLGTCYQCCLWRKAISFYMPDCLHGFRAGSNDGNPMKSCCVKVNDFLSCSLGSWQQEETRSRFKYTASNGQKGVLTFACSFQDIWWTSQFRDLDAWNVNFQFHMIARCDDTTQVMMDHICVHNHLRMHWKQLWFEARMYRMKVMQCGRLCLEVWTPFSFNSSITGITSLTRT